MSNHLTVNHKTNTTMGKNTDFGAYNQRVQLQKAQRIISCITRADDKLLRAYDNLKEFQRVRPLDTARLFQTEEQMYHDLDIAKMAAKRLRQYYINHITKMHELL